MTTPHPQSDREKCIHEVVGGDYKCVDCGHSFVPIAPVEDWETELTVILTRHATGKYTSESTFISDLKSLISKVRQDAVREERERVVKMVDEMLEESDIGGKYWNGQTALTALTDKINNNNK